MDKPYSSCDISSWPHAKCPKIIIKLRFGFVFRDHWSNFTFLAQKNITICCWGWQNPDRWLRLHCIRSDCKTFEVVQKTWSEFKLKCSCVLKRTNNFFTNEKYPFCFLLLHRQHFFVQFKYKSAPAIFFLFNQHSMLFYINPDTRWENKGVNQRI